MTAIGLADSPVHLQFVSDLVRPDGSGVDQRLNLGKHLSRGPRTLRSHCFALQNSKSLFSVEHGIIYLGIGIWIGVLLSSHEELWTLHKKSRGTRFKTRCDGNSTRLRGRVMLSASPAGLCPWGTVGQFEALRMISCFRLRRFA